MSTIPPLKLGTRLAIVFLPCLNHNEGMETAVLQAGNTRLTTLMITGSSGGYGPPGQSSDLSASAPAPATLVSISACPEVT